jgi:hypothetical protein
MIVFNPVLGFVMSRFLTLFTTGQYKSAEANSGSSEAAKRFEFKWDFEKCFDD